MHNIIRNKRKKILNSIAISHRFLLITFVKCIFLHKKYHYARIAMISIYNNIITYILFTKKSRSWCWPVRVTRRPAKRGRRCGTVDQLGSLRPRWGSQFWQKIFPIRNIDVILITTSGQTTVVWPLLNNFRNFWTLNWGMRALRQIGMEEECLKAGVKMFARMIHNKDGSTYAVPYGRTGKYFEI